MFGIVVVAIVVTGVALGAVVAKKKNRDAVKWAAACGLLMVPMLPILLALPSLRSEEELRQAEWEARMNAWLIKNGKVGGILN